MKAAVGRGQGGVPDEEKVVGADSESIPGLAHTRLTPQKKYLFSLKFTLVSLRVVPAPDSRICVCILLSVIFSRPILQIWSINES